MRFDLGLEVAKLPAEVGLGEDAEGALVGVEGGQAQGGEEEEGEGHQAGEDEGPALGRGGGLGGWSAHSGGLVVVGVLRGRGGGLLLVPLLGLALLGPLLGASLGLGALLGLGLLGGGRGGSGGSAEGGGSGPTPAAGRGRWVRRGGSASEVRPPAEETGYSATIGIGSWGRSRSLPGLVRRRALAVRLAGALPTGGGRGCYLGHGCDKKK